MKIARTAYYNGIAKQWHRVTGYHGGTFKRYVLNDFLLDKVGHIEGGSILELGVGNGYFALMMLRRFSGQSPHRLVITDQAQALVHIAQSTFGIENAEYLTLDVQDGLPFSEGEFDLVLATMLFNELPLSVMRNAARECQRVLVPGGCLLATMPHPALVYGLAKHGALTDLDVASLRCRAPRGCDCPLRAARLMCIDLPLKRVDLTSARRISCPMRRRSTKRRDLYMRGVHRWRYFATVGVCRMLVQRYLDDSVTLHIRFALL